MADSDIPRLALGRPLPPYTFVPWRSPHPINDPGGHSYGARHDDAPPIDPDDWRASEDYLFGIDLFNHGYYWEAHEAWEGLWHKCGRSGTTADFLKGLIQMTAAGVKVRQGIPDGVASLAGGAARLFRKVLDAMDPAPPRYLGLDLNELLAFVRDLEERPDLGPVPPDHPVRPIFSLVLRPS